MIYCRHLKFIKVSPDLETNNGMRTGLSDGSQTNPNKRTLSKCNRCKGAYQRRSPISVISNGRRTGLSDGSQTNPNLRTLKKKWASQRLHLVGNWSLMRLAVT